MVVRTFQSIPLRFALEYPRITIHAISRDTNHFAEECIYLQVEREKSDEGDGAGGDIADEEEDDDEGNDDEDNDEDDQFEDASDHQDGNGHGIPNNYAHGSSEDESMDLDDGDR
ncbi:hypothetical protein M8J76_003100 [Diaphorina citri]|nr:hypothetical protein M8J76_003100 [Diaphorina citri]